MWEKSKEFLYGLTKRALAALTVVVSPLYSVAGRRVNVGFLGVLKNGFLSLIGKGAPFQEDADNIRSSQSEKKRGNVFNPSFANDGRLSLRLMDGLVREDALQVFDSVDIAGMANASTADKALNSLEAGKISRETKNAFREIWALKERLEERGGSLSVERSHDGFGRVLVIKVGIADKSEEDIRRELEDVFKTIGISDPELAKSIAEQLLKRGGADLSKTGNSISVTDSRASENLPNVGDDKVVGSRGESSYHPGAEKTEGQQRGFGNGDVPDESFSMSGKAIPPSFTPADSTDTIAAKQFQFLKDGDTSSRGSASINGGIELATMNASLKDAAEGLEGLDMVEPDPSSSAPRQPTLSATTQKPGRSSGASREI